MNMNKECCSVYCPCIRDTVPLVECDECTHFVEDTCQYQDEKDKEVEETENP